MIKGLFVVIGLVGMMLGLCFLTMRVVKEVQFDRGCEGYLKRAADANTIDLAKEQMQIALKYIEDNGLTQGYTSVIYNTPDEDVGFWYKNLKASYAELCTVTPETSQLERTNVLMKLRETLLDTHDKGVSVTAPDGISVYPNNLAYFFFGLFSGILAFFGFIVFVGVIADA
jgi:hypothetical protein